MKTEICFESGRFAAGLRFLWRGAMLIAAITSGGFSLFAGPTVQTFGGGATGSKGGYVNGETAYAEFRSPMGLAIDSFGNLYIADYGNNVVREIFDPNGSAGGTTETYSTNIAPVGVAIDGNNNLFVLSRGGTGAVSTNGMVVEYDMYGILVATNATHLTNAAAIALDTSGNIYVTERSNLVVKIAGGVNTTVAAITATNAFLKGIAVLPDGNLAVCDFGRNGIYTINPTTGIWTTNAGFNGAGDGTGPNNVGIPNSMAKFFQPFGVAAAGDGTLIVSDYGNDRVKVVTVAGVTTNFYGVSSNDWVSANPPYQFPGWVDGTVTVPDEIGGVAGRCPAGVLLSPDGSTVYTTEDYYHLIRKTTGTAFAEFVTPPAAPSGLTATLETNGMGQVVVLLSWTAGATGNATNYLVERSTSPSGYSIIGETNGLNFVDDTANAGTPYYYVIQAANSGGLSADSSVASVTIPEPPPGPPTIGWFDYELNLNGQYVSTFHAITNQITTYNDLNYAIINGSGVIDYISGPTPLSGSPTNGAGAPTYANNSTVPQTPLDVTTTTNLTIEAVSYDNGQYSAIVSANIIYQTAAPALVNATNAASFYLDDVTSNVIYYYTTDGSDPLTNQVASQKIVATNGPVEVNLNISSNFLFSVRAFRAGYLPSSLQTNFFLGQNFQGNELTWGFASGYCSSTFVASPGEWFYAPVTLTTLPSTAMFGLGFDMFVTNLGVHAISPGAFSFESYLRQPATESNTETKVLEEIPPLMFASTNTVGPIVDYNGVPFENGSEYDTNLNELAVTWLEMYGKTNLYNTLAQNLITYSEAFIQVLPSASNPNQVIVGGYAFQVPTNATPGEQYEITLQNGAADSDGLGVNGSAVIINTPTTGSLSAGTINAVKIVTIGQPKYLVGDVYPFQWFNAGNFGSGNFNNWVNDLQDVFDAAIYNLNVPPANSDLFDAMDSAGGFGVLDGQTGYWTNQNLTVTDRNALFNANDDSTINQMAFGDGVLDICDVYTTFLRANFADAYWFQRFYTNDTINGVYGRIAVAITSHTNVSEDVMAPPSGKGSYKAADSSQPSLSITNTPAVRFAAGDYIVSPGETNITIPVTATIYGPTPLRMLAFHVFVTPLDGSPALTTPVTFSAAAPFNNSSLFSSLGTNTEGDCAAAFLPTTLPFSSSVNVTGSNVIGYLNITIPPNATSSSAYAISFAHASASPNGLLSFPRTIHTGLITLSSRTNSYYGDGIPDCWRLRYFGTVYNELSVSNADADGTGMNNWQKYQAGLNPVDSTSVFNEGMDQKMAQSPQDMVIYWPSVSGQTYVIKRSTALFPPQWTSISTNIGNGTYMEIHDASGGANRYYEVTTPGQQ